MKSEGAERYTQLASEFWGRGLYGSVKAARRRMTKCVGRVALVQGIFALIIERLCSRERENLTERVRQE